jgi:hypothetical protein
MDLEYKMKDSALKSSTGKPQVVRVEFDPPLLGYEEVKPRLLGMKADADSALGTVRPNPYSIRFASPPLSNLTPTPVHLSQSFTCCIGQIPANHAFRTTVPDLDHRIPPALPDIHL